MTLNELIEITTPSTAEDLNDCLMRFTRGLKFEIGYGEMSGANIGEPFFLWWKAVEESIGSQDLEENIANFEWLFEEAYAPLMSNVLEEAIRHAKQSETKYGLPTDAYNLLCRIHHEADKLTSGAIHWVSTRDAGKALGKSHRTIGKMQKLLVRRKLLEVAIPHTNTRSTRYFFKGESSAKGNDTQEAPT